MSNPNSDDYTEADRDRLDAVETFADTVLEVGRDQWSGQDTPLFADGVTVEDHEPVRWEIEGKTTIPSNLASQQHLVRTLQGLSALTGEDRYEDAARDAVTYHFDTLAPDNGLLYWGSEMIVDLDTLDPVPLYGKGNHELKSHFPDYDFLWDVDPEATARLLRTTWDQHILDWRVLDMNRHGSWTGSPPQNPWDHPWDDPEAYFESEGLTFVNTGADLVLAAGQLYRFTDEADAWTWGERMAGMYEKARHPDTGLGSMQYSKAKRREQPPEEGSLAEYTSSTYGDRAENQFGDQFGDAALEGWCLWGNPVPLIHYHSATALLWIGDKLGADGERLVRETTDSLLAFFEYAYDADEHAFRPMWADGTDLTGLEYGRTGYYGEKGTTWELRPPDPGYLRVLLLAYERTGDDRLWEPIQSMAAGEGIGRLADDPAGDHAVEPDGVSASPDELYALLALYRVTEDRAVLERARAVGDAIVDERFYNGLFVHDSDLVNARFDAVEPLALLELDAAIRGRPEDVPDYLAASGALHRQFEGPDTGRPYNFDEVWGVTE